MIKNKLFSTIILRSELLEMVKLMDNKLGLYVDMELSSIGNKRVVLGISKITPFFSSIENLKEKEIK